MFTWWVVGGFYLVAAAAFFFFRWFYRLINQPSFRDDQGDVSTEVGYEEDSFGDVLPEAGDDFDHSHTSPHVNATGNIHSGPM